MDVKGATKDVLFHTVLYACNRRVAYFPSRRARLAFYRRLMHFEIGSGSHIFMGAWFDTRRNFKMGRNSTINQGCRLDNRGGITIGDNVTVAADVCILTADHDQQSPYGDARLRPVVLDDHVFVGTRAMLLPGVTVGRGSVVAAGAVATRDVPPLTIVAGVPARPIGSRPDDFRYNASYSRLLQ